jgi:hypothetical protein
MNFLNTARLPGTAEVLRQALRYESQSGMQHEKGSRRHFGGSRDPARALLADA